MLLQILSNQVPRLFVTAYKSVISTQSVLEFAPLRTAWQNTAYICTSLVVLSISLRPGTFFSDLIQTI